MFDVLAQDRTLTMLENTMNVASARHSLIASNIANIDTPDYKAKDIAFKQELKIALDRAMNSDLESVSGTFSYDTEYKPAVIYEENVVPRQDGNTVDLDKELGKLSQTTSTFSKAATIYSLKLKLIKQSLQGG